MCVCVCVCVCVYVGVIHEMCVHMYMYVFACVYMCRRKVFYEEASGQYGAAEFK